MENWNEISFKNARACLKLGGAWVITSCNSRKDETQPKQEWEKIDNKGNEANTKAFYCSFNGVSPREFKSMVTCKYTKKKYE